MRIDYVWCDGYSEIICSTRDEALRIRGLRGQGKVWRREFSKFDNILEGVTDVTEKDHGV